MNSEQTAPQLQMIWPSEKAQIKPQVPVPAGFALRTYQPGDETRFFTLMELAGWPEWDEQILQPWLFRILPQGWFMITHKISGEIVATAMATHDHT